MIWLWLALAQAHPLAPSVLTLTESPQGVEATFRTPMVRVSGTEVTAVLPCPVASGPAVTGEGTAVESRWTLTCTSLEGETAGADGLETAGTNALIDLRRADAEPELVLLAGAGARHVIGPAGRAPAVVWDHLDLGLRHLISGLDHVLFVLGLVLLVPVRRLVVAVTAFTVGHALSLTAAVLGGVTVAWAEVLIAASLMWLALEVLRPPASGESWVARRPWLVCLPFGLVHGLGFAGSLRELGLPEGGVIRALLGFNLGIELGQLAVVGAAVAVGWWAGPLSSTWRARAAWLGGGIGAMWVLERMALLIP